MQQRALFFLGGNCRLLRLFYGEKKRELLHLRKFGGEMNQSPEIRTRLSPTVMTRKQFQLGSSGERETARRQFFSSFPQSPALILLLLIPNSPLLPHSCLLYSLSSPAMLWESVGGSRVRFFIPTMFSAARLLLLLEDDGGQIVLTVSFVSCLSWFALHQSI